MSKEFYPKLSSVLSKNSEQSSRSTNLERTGSVEDDRLCDNEDGPVFQSKFDRSSNKASGSRLSMDAASEDAIVALRDHGNPFQEHGKGSSTQDGRQSPSSFSAEQVPESSEASRLAKNVSWGYQISSDMLPSMRTATEPIEGSFRRLCNEQDSAISEVKENHQILKNQADKMIKMHTERARNAEREVATLKKQLSDLSEKYEDSKQHTMAMQQQISGLQSDLVIAAKTKPNLLADDAIRERFGALCWRLEQWVRFNVRAGTLDPLKNLLPETMATLVSVCPQSQGMEVKKGNLCVASAHWIFRNALTGSWYPGLPDDGPLSSLEDVENHMSWTNVCLDEWRSTTYSAIKSTPNNDIVKASSDLCHNTARNVCAVLEDLTSVQIGPGNTFNELVSIAQTALDLSQTLHAQRARFEVRNWIVNKESIPFNLEEFERENADDPPSGRVQEYVGMITMPCLYKFGDNFNQQSNFTGVVCKGKALARAVAQPNSE